MLKGYMYKSIIRLWKLGKSKKSISRNLGHDIKTVRKIVKQYEELGISDPRIISRKSALDLHREKIVKYVEFILAVSSCDGLIHSSTYVSVVWFIKLYTVFDRN